MNLIAVDFAGENDRKPMETMEFCHHTFGFNSLYSGKLWFLNWEGWPTYIGMIPLSHIYTHRWAFKKPKCRTYICGLVKWNGHGDDKYEWNQHRFEWDNHQNFMFFEITPAFFLRWTNSAQNNHVETQTTANKTKTLCNPFPLGYWSFPAIARLQ